MDYDKTVAICDTVLHATAWIASAALARKALKRGGNAVQVGFIMLAPLALGLFEVSVRTKTRLERLEELRSDACQEE